jgi:hypothetical protein
LKPSLPTIEMISIAIGSHKLIAASAASIALSWGCITRLLINRCRGSSLGSIKNLNNPSGMTMWMKISGDFHSIGCEYMRHNIEVYSGSTSRPTFSLLITDPQTAKAVVSRRRAQAERLDNNISVNFNRNG